MYAVCALAARVIRFQCNAHISFSPCLAFALHLRLGSFDFRKADPHSLGAFFFLIRTRARRTPIDADAYALHVFSRLIRDVLVRLRLLAHIFYKKLTFSVPYQKRRAVFLKKKKRNKNFL